MLPVDTQCPAQPGFEQRRFTWLFILFFSPAQPTEQGYPIAPLSPDTNDSTGYPVIPASKDGPLVIATIILFLGMLILNAETYQNQAVFPVILFIDMFVVVAVILRAMSGSTRGCVASVCESV